jgi:photosystem II stability/assembly factor-like uncharacterized protein
MWKGNMFHLDGWLSRIVTALDAARDDPAVLYAVDEANDLYRSGDAARSWQWIGRSPAPAVFKIVCGAKRRYVFLAAPSGAFRSITGGQSWSKLPLPADCGELTDLQLDRTNPNRLYAVTPQGVYRSIDFGEKWIGQRWEKVVPHVPPGRSVHLVLVQGHPTMLYGLVDGDVRSKRLDGGPWSPAVRIAYTEYIGMYPWLLVRPDKPSELLCCYKLDLRQLRREGLSKGALVGSLLSRSGDGGATWSYSQPNVMKSLREKGATFTLGKMLLEMFPHPIEAITFDAKELGTLYAATDKSFFVSRNGGRSWRELKDGLDIPKVRTIFTPAAGEVIYAGTPAGLYRLKRGQTHWQYANLRLQFEKNHRRDLGGAAYLDAYWRGRYFGFITDDEASQLPSKWKIPEKYRDRVPQPSEGR